MQPLSGESFRSNAFRTLGLSGLADQSAIQGAARRMRIWPDAKDIPATPWDMPDLGSLSRSKPDIEQAVASLNQPILRLEHRLLWYVMPLPPLQLQQTVDADKSDAATLHAWIVAALHGGLIGDVRRPRIWTWLKVAEHVADFSASDQALAWQHQLESRGDFEKPASTKEISAALMALPESLGAALVKSAQVSFRQGRYGELSGIFQALRLLESRLTISCVQPMLDSLEDQLNQYCQHLDRQLRDGLRTIKSNPTLYYESNLRHSTAGRLYYDVRIRGAVSVLTTLAADEPWRLERFQGECAKVLALLALGWEWAGEFLNAAASYAEASSLARSPKLKDSYLFDARRCNATTPPRIPRIPKKPKSFRFIVGCIVAVFVTVSVIAVFGMLVSDIVGGHTTYHMRSPSPAKPVNTSVDSSWDVILKPPSGSDATQPATTMP